MMEKVIKNEELLQEKLTMKNTITELLRELALTARSIATDEACFLDTIAELDVTDIAGTVGTLAARFLTQCGKTHFREFREYTSSN